MKKMGIDALVDLGCPYVGENDPLDIVLDLYALNIGLLFNICSLPKLTASRMNQKCSQT